MDDKQIKEKVSEGYLHIRSIIEIVGKPKEYVEKTMADYLKKIKSDKNYEIVKETVEPAEQKENFFSSFVELEILIKNADLLLSFCFDYMPSSVEIIAPETTLLKNNEFTGFINDLQTRLHGLNTGLLQEREHSKFYIRNTAVLLRNFLVVLLSSKPMTVKEMHPFLGVRQSDIEKVLDVLVNEGKVEKKGDKYNAIVKK